jgi:hypothetical protein
VCECVNGGKGVAKVFGGAIGGVGHRIGGMG